MPRTSTAEWRRSLTEDLAPDENVEDAYEALVHTLGNLTLTGYNSELGNEPFPVKRARLAKSGITMNQRIAACHRWGRTEIHARADALADRIISIWPGPTEQASRSDVAWDIMDKALSELPAGAWTTYGDIAALIGSHPVPVGTRLASSPVPNAHRVLQVDGAVSPGFRWLDPARTDDPHDLLRAEGVEFDQYGRANPAQRVSIEELAQLAGLSPEDLQEQIPRQRSGKDDTYRDRFVEQLTHLQGEKVTNATLALLDAWTNLGGTLLYGSGGETSCFLVAREKQHRLGNLYSATIYPSGKFEVAFQHMCTRAPFDDVTLREEFRQRLNRLPGVDIAAARIALRPGFPLTVLTDPAATDALIEHLAWFHTQAYLADADRETSFARR